MSNDLSSQKVKEIIRSRLRIAQSAFPSGEDYESWDSLGFNFAKNAFRKTIDAAIPPLTIGLYGAWGSGKTEMIKALYSDLEREGQTTLIFDAWKYRHEKNLILPLICALDRKYSDKTQAIKKSVKKIVTSIALVVGNQYIKNKTGVNIEEIKSVMEMHEKDYEYYKKYEDTISKIEDEYKSFIDKLLKKQKSEKVIIFIDNLDRCLPDVVVNLLEDICSFLSISGISCVYVLALDKEHVVKAINHRFPDFDAFHYLEKIVQADLSMPLPQARDDQDSSWGLYHFLKRYEWGKVYETQSKAGDSRDKVFNLLKTINPVFSSAFLGNPRKSERVVNKLMTLEAMGFFEIEASDEASLIVFMILFHENFNNIFKILKYDEDFERLKSCLEMISQEATNPTRLRHDRPGMRFKTVAQEVIINAYCDLPRFSEFLSMFKALANYPELIPKLQKIKKYLDLIG